MVNFRIPFRGLGLGFLLVVGVFSLPGDLCGQTSVAPAQSTTNGSDTSGAEKLPAVVQAQLDKLEEALKTARAAGDAKGEQEALNRAWLWHRQSCRPIPNTTRLCAPILLGTLRAHG
jgi:hypothetical protein